MQTTPHLNTDTTVDPTTGERRSGVGMAYGAGDVIAADRVEGTKVYDTRGEKLGSIDDVMIDKRSGQVRYAVLEFGGFLGMGTDRYPLPWNILKYDTNLEGYVVPLGKEQLEGAPRYASNEPPSYDPEYGRSVNQYYGIGW